LTIDRIKR